MVPPTPKMQEATWAREGRGSNGVVETLTPIHLSASSPGNNDCLGTGLPMEPNSPCLQSLSMITDELCTWNYKLLQKVIFKF